MTRFALCAAVLSLPLVLATAPAFSADDDPMTNDLARNGLSQDEPGNAVSGKDLFEKHCVSCHGPNGKSIGGQQVDVLLEKLKLYHQQKTFENPRVQAMHDALAPMNPQNLEDLAAYIHSL